MIGEGTWRKEHKCEQHCKQAIQLLCIEKKCNDKRICCISCIDEGHRRHDVVSLSKFEEIMQTSLQVNNQNSDKHRILADLKKSRESFSHKLEIVRSKINAVLARCESSIDAYYDKLYKSFAVDKHTTLVAHLYRNLSTETVEEYLALIQQIEQMALGSYYDTKVIIDTSLSMHTQKINEALSSSLEMFEKIAVSLKTLSFASNSKNFQRIFSRRMKSSMLTIDDSMKTIDRPNGQGGYPITLLASPFDPINNHVKFRIEKNGDQSKKGVWLGVCLYDVVKTLNYQNCAGVGKGVYSIDQSSPYYLGGESDNMLAVSWNHHDAQYNQMTAGGNNLVGWKFGAGDCIKVEIDYYNSVVIFSKILDSDSIDSEQEMEQYYEMPIKIDQGPIYAFAGTSSKGDVVSIVDV